jgi:diacylglycerol kinase (ATP)
VTSPFGPPVIIANPHAGQGKVDKRLPEVERTLASAGLSCRIVRTTHPGHATETAAEAIRRGQRYLVAAGGDGTVHEVLNGMLLIEADGEMLGTTPATFEVVPRAIRLKV